MDIKVYSIKTVEDEKIAELIGGHESFVLEDVDRINIGKAVETLEKLIESKGFSCRVYTAGRAGAMVGAVIPTPVTVVAGWASAVAIGAHNLATWNPDYEIAKNIAIGTLTVEYKK
jgi:hypothetical protein